MVIFNSYVKLPEGNCIFHPGVEGVQVSKARGNHGMIRCRRCLWGFLPPTSSRVALGPFRFKPWFRICTWHIWTGPKNHGMLMAFVIHYDIDTHWTNENVKKYIQILIKMCRYAFFWLRYLSDPKYITFFVLGSQRAISYKQHLLGVKLSVEALAFRQVSLV